MENSPCYPLFLLLEGRRCVVVGGGKVAVRKVADLLDTGADVIVVADVTLPAIEEQAQAGSITLIRRSFEPGDIDNTFLVFAATDDSAVNAKIAEIARKNGTLINAVDDPENCDFFSGAQVKRGPLRIAISTSGQCPGLAAALRKELEERYPGSLGDFIRVAGEMRSYVQSKASLTPDGKKRALDWISSGAARTFFTTSGEEKVWTELQKMISS